MALPPVSRRLNPAVSSPSFARGEATGPATSTGRSESASSFSNATAPALVPGLFEVLPAQPAEIPERIQNLAADLDDVMLDHPDRMWPAYDWKNFQVMLVDNESKRAFLWNDRSDPSGARMPVQEVAYDQLPLGFKSTFAYGNWNGHDTMAISLQYGTVRPGSPDPALNLAIHEGFHHVAQRDFADRISGQRWEEYPEDYRPRFLRDQLLSNLRRAFLDKDSAALGAAAYWNQRYKTEFPDEAKLMIGTDTVEGTARYAEVLGAVLGQLGGTASEKDVMEAARKMADGWTKPGRYDKDGDSYALGLLACLMIREQGNAGPAWEKMKQLNTPVDVLLEGVAPVAPPADTAAEEKAKEAIETRNTERAATLNDLKGTLESKDHYRMLLPWKWHKGSFGMHGAAVIKTEPGEPLLLERSNYRIEQPGGQGKLEINDQHSMLISGEVYGHFKGDAALFAVPKASVTREADGTLSIQSEGVTAQGMRLREVTDAKGLTWLVPEAVTG